MKNLNLYMKLCDNNIIKLRNNMNKTTFRFQHIYPNGPSTIIDKGNNIYDWK